jgi:hypothetical protein
LGLYLVPLQYLCLFYDLSKCILRVFVYEGDSNENIKSAIKVQKQLVRLVS